MLPFLLAVSAIKPKLCSDKQLFSLKSLHIDRLGNLRGQIMRVRIFAESQGQTIEHPYLEGRLRSDRIPEVRFRDELCRPGVLDCPVTFGKLIYGKQISVPPTIPPGMYTLELIFREKNKEIIGCYSTEIDVK